MKKISLSIMVIILSMMFLVGIVYAEDLVMKASAGEYSVTAKFDKMPPFVGENTFHVNITDASGKKISDAKVEVTYFMAEMLSGTRKSVVMPYMGSTTGAEKEDSEYMAKVNFSMAGHWDMFVKINRNDETSTADFHILLK